MTPALEPLYTLRQAADLVPTTSVAALRQFLYRHRGEYPARYYLVGRGKRRHRLLSQSEILRIRAVKQILTTTGRSSPGPYK